MEPSTNQEICNLLVQSLIAKDQTALLKVLDQEDKVIEDVVNRLPPNHARGLLLELRNLMSNEVSSKQLRWLQQLLVSKFSVISSMADGRSILMPMLSLLEDKSNPDYYNKLQTLKGKLSLLSQLKSTVRSEVAE